MAAYVRMFARTMSTIKSAHLESSSRVLQVTWDGKEHNGRVAKYPVTWLRDSCLCSECYQSSCDMKLMHLRDLDAHISPKTIKIADSKNLEITWPNNHVSTFGSEWLLKHDFGGHGHQFNKQHDNINVEPKLWRAEMKHELKKFDYKQLIEDDSVLYNWLVELERVGLVQITNAPPDTTVIDAIGARVGYMRTTNYGETFRVESKDNPSNVAYTPNYLPLHTDLPFYEYTPGIQMLHYIVQPDGMTSGENEFVDGFRAAEDLRHEDPKAFKLLSELLVDFHDKGEDFTKFKLHYKRPTIRLNENGDVVSVNFNNATRDALSHIPLDQVQNFYVALKKLDSLFYDPRNIVQFKMRPGDVISFHNHRVLHGRKSYQLSAESSARRLLVGGYLDWDEARSRRRVLMQELSK